MFVVATMLAIRYFRGSSCRNPPHFADLLSGFGAFRSLIRVEDLCKGFSTGRNERDCRRQWALILLSTLSPIFLFKTLANLFQQVDHYLHREQSRIGVAGAGVVAHCEELAL